MFFFCVLDFASFQGSKTAKEANNVGCHAFSCIYAVCVCVPAWTSLGDNAVRWWALCSEVGKGGRR